VLPRGLVLAGQQVGQESGLAHWLHAMDELAPAGYDVGIDLSELVEGVVVAPEAADWLVDLVRDVSTRYGLAVPVSRSDLDTDPV
jgi:hypothetical protein